MHETGIIKGLIHQLQQAAREAGAERVAAVDVWLGALSQMSAPHFRNHFEEDALGTLVEGATLTIEESDDPTDPKAQSVLVRSADMVV